MVVHKVRAGEQAPVIVGIRRGLRGRKYVSDVREGVGDQGELVRVKGERICGDVFGV